jgi:hypothetical protein
MFVALFLVCLGVISTQAVDNGYDSRYPANSLNNPGASFSLGGSLPSPRVQHSIALTSSYIQVYGGYDKEGFTLGDVNLYHIPTQAWSNPVNRSECCNEASATVDLIGSTAQIQEGSQMSSTGALREVTFPFLKPGFEGDAPLPRAEHGSCALGEVVYIFGGVTDYFRRYYNDTFSEDIYLQDIYRFDPLLLRWQNVITQNGRQGMPRRRAGHNMLCDTSTNQIYIYGGRNGETALGDLWAFDTQSLSWQRLSGDSNSHSKHSTSRSSSLSSSPASRQYAAAVSFNQHIYIYGGNGDPATGMLLNDLWAFDLLSERWEVLSHPANPAWSYNYVPSGLVHAHLLPSLDPNSGYLGLLLYGGLSSGGLCFGTPQCNAEQTLLGQLYHFSFTQATWTPPLVDANDLEAVAQALSDNVTTQWQYARLHSALVDDDLTILHSRQYQGKYLKTYGYEQVVYDAYTQCMYEFGGLMTNVPLDIAPSNAYYSASGGFLPTELADVHTGEILQTRVSLVGNAYWDAGIQYRDKVHMQRALRQFRVGAQDIILTMEHSLP